MKLALCSVLLISIFYLPDTTNPWDEAMGLFTRGVIQILDAGPELWAKIGKYQADRNVQTIISGAVSNRDGLAPLAFSRNSDRRRGRGTDRNQRNDFRVLVGLTHRLVDSQAPELWRKLMGMVEPEQECEIESQCLDEFRKAVEADKGSGALLAFRPSFTGTWTFLTNRYAIVSLPIQYRLRAVAYASTKEAPSTPFFIF